MKFVSSKISSTSPYEFDLDILYKDRDDVGRSLFTFIGAVLRRGVEVNKTVTVWQEWSERVVWDTREKWHTVRTFEGLHFTDGVTHPGFGRVEKLGTLTFQTSTWKTGPAPTAQEVGLLIYSTGGIIGEVEVYANPQDAKTAYFQWWSDEGLVWWDEEGVDPNSVIEAEIASRDGEIAEWRIAIVKGDK